ncbi:MAG: serine/threonine-protein kinase [Planctomycetota bacterium]
MSEHDQDESDRLRRILGAAFAPPTVPDRDLVRAIVDAAEPLALAGLEETRDLEARYEVGAEIARGGMGVVYRARDLALGRTVAVKTIAPGHPRARDLASRLVAEARIAGQLEHPGIVPLHDFGRLRDGRPVVVFRLVEGRTLAELLALRDDDPAACPDLLDVFEQASRAMAHAHAQGVVHRDLKPDNIMVGSFGETQVMDWGLARIRGLPAPTSDEESGPVAVMLRDSLSGAVVGTAAYMAPEQARGENDGAGTERDVFSLGAILLEILTGRPAFLGEDLADVLERARRGDLADAFSALDAPGVPTELAELARRCLAADPAARPDGAGELARAVAEFRSRLEARTRASEIESAAALARAEEERRARRLGVALAAVIGLVAVGAAIAVALFLAARDERRADADRRAAALLERASALHEAAGSAPLDDLRSWGEALAAASTACELLEGHHCVAAERLRDRVVADAAARDAARRARRRLREMRPHREDERSVAVLRAGLAEIFASLDLRPLEGEIGPAATAIAVSPIAVDLVGALDDWYELEIAGGSEDAADRLFGVALLADADARCREIRLDIRRGDREALRRAAAAAGGPADSAEFLSLLARGLRRSGQGDEEKRILRLARRRFPDHDRLAHDLGVVLLTGSPTEQGEAARAFAAAVALRPGQAHYRSDLVIALRQLGRLDEALAEIAIVNETWPEDANAWFRRGNVHVARGEYEEALASFDRAVALDETLAQAWCNRGLALQRFGRTEDAVASYERALAQNSRLAAAHVGWGGVLLQTGRGDEALDHFRRAVAIAPKAEKPRKALAVALLELGFVEEAAERLREIVAEVREGETDAGSLRLSLGAALAMRGEIEAAEEEARAALQSGVDSDARHLLARCRAARGDFSGALAMMREAGSDATATGMVRGAGEREYAALADLERAVAAGAGGENDPLPARLGRAYLLGLRGEWSDSAAIFDALRDAPEMKETAPAVLVVAARSALGRDGESGVAAKEARAWLELAVANLRRAGVPPLAFRLTFAHREIRATREAAFTDRLDDEERGLWRDLWREIDASAAPRLPTGER